MSHNATVLLEMLVSAVGDNPSDEQVADDTHMTLKMVESLMVLDQGQGAIALLLMATGAPPQIIAATGVGPEVAMVSSMARTVAVSRHLNKLKKRIAVLEEELVGYRAQSQVDWEAS